MERLGVFFWKYWFLAGLFGVALVTLTDGSETVADAGRWLGAHGGPNVVIFLIFFLSGISLAAEEIKKGLSDLKTALVALAVIFVLSPLLASGIAAVTPLSAGTRIGLCLVAIMPTTLSSGVVMTAAAGGNMASALMITVLANVLGIFTVPLSLQVLLGTGSEPLAFHLDKSDLMLQMALLVIAPLFLGLYSRSRLLPFFNRLGFRLSILSQLLVLTIVWIAVSRSRGTLVGSLPLLGSTVLLSFFFHALLLLTAFLASRLFRLGAGRREALIFMGGQKTLPLSVLIQVSLFPSYGEALVVCVLHHMVHLIMDGYLVGRMTHRG